MAFRKSQLMRKMMRKHHCLCSAALWAASVSLGMPCTDTNPCQEPWWLSAAWTRTLVWESCALCFLNIIFLQTLAITVFAPSFVGHEIARAGQANMFALLSRGAKGVIPLMARPRAWSLWHCRVLGWLQLSPAQGGMEVPQLFPPGQILGALCKASQLLSNSCSSTGMVF